VEIPLEYSRGGMRTRALPAVKIHLTFDEPVLTKAVTSVVTPRYSDLGEFTIPSYSKTEIVAEKLRALLRDLYDLWFMICRSKEKFEPGELAEIFKRKCEVRKIEPDFSGLRSGSLKEWNTGAWENQMKPLMKSIPDFPQVWEEWVSGCRSLFEGIS
jgi:predicted nucleotidyltransferase component of viral defense system